MGWGAQMAYTAISNFPDVSKLTFPELDALANVWAERRAELEGSGAYSDFLRKLLPFYHPLRLAEEQQYPRDASQSVRQGRVSIGPLSDGEYMNYRAQFLLVTASAPGEV